MISASLFALLLGVASVAGANTPVIARIQVTEPLPLPSNVHTCTIKILEHTFGNSYGHPDIVEYSPPTDCGDPGSWAAVTLNLTGTSNRRQYDRLAVLTFQNTEIWRTSTSDSGGDDDATMWTYAKDVTRYMPLFTDLGVFILELDNRLLKDYDGQYNITLYATFYAASEEHLTAKQSNVIVPISTMSNTSADDASVPPSFSVNDMLMFHSYDRKIMLPRNTVEIYAELYASGSGAEEFWYTDVPDQYIAQVPPNITYGRGPFREVRILVDNQVACAVHPYPVIFTGGFNPFLWRRIVSHGAFDLPTYFCDLTPFAPTFADGRPHVVTLDVVSAEKNHAINQNWYLSASLQVVTDPSGKPTMGQITRYDAQPYAVTETSARVGVTELNVTVKAQRSLYIEAVVIGGSGKKTTVTFSQNFSYSNQQYFYNDLFSQNVTQISSGNVSSVHNGVPSVVDKFEYPLFINLALLNSTNTSQLYYSLFDHSYNRQVDLASFILGSMIEEHQQAAGYVTIVNGTIGNSGNGTNNNTFSYIDTQGNTYNREVNAVDTVIVYDHESGSLVKT